MLKKTFLSVLLIILFVPIFANAYSNYVIVGGENIGIKLKSKGVIVVGFYEVDNKYIAKEAGIKIGDRIIEINNQSINSINELTTNINSSDGFIKITYIRDNITKYTNLVLSKDESNNFKTGIYAKDSITGIGTLTYIDPNTKLFGALGHEIVESSTSKILEISDGKIYESNVTDIEPSSNGNPGEKNAQVLSDEINGLVFENTIKGIFGNYTDEFDNTKLKKVAQPHEIQKGNAKILTVLEGNTVTEYDINIIKINNNGKVKNILFEITDKELLEKTTGVIQGMSGSPIIQNDYIIGAVTHVVVDNPHKGYGIFITNMLEEAEN